MEKAGNLSPSDDAINSLIRTGERFDILAQSSEDTDFIDSLVDAQRDEGFTLDRQLVNLPDGTATGSKKVGPPDASRVLFGAAIKLHVSTSSPTQQQNALRFDAGSSGNDSSEPNASDPGAAYKLHVSASSGSQQQNVLRSDAESSGNDSSEPSASDPGYISDISDAESTSETEPKKCDADADTCQMKQADIFVEEVVSFVSDELEMQSFRKSLQQFLLNEAAAAQLKKCIDDVEQEITSGLPQLPETESLPQLPETGTLYEVPEFEIIPEVPVRLASPEIDTYIDPLPSILRPQTRTGTPKQIRTKRSTSSGLNKLSFSQIEPVPGPSRQQPTPKRSTVLAASRDRSKYNLTPRPSTSRTPQHDPEEIQAYIEKRRYERKLKARTEHNNRVAEQERRQSNLEKLNRDRHYKLRVKHEKKANNPKVQSKTSIDLAFEMSTIPYKVFDEDTQSVKTVYPPTPPK